MELKSCYNRLFHLRINKIKDDLLFNCFIENAINNNDFVIILNNNKFHKLLVKYYRDYIHDSLYDRVYVYLSYKIFNKSMFINFNVENPYKNFFTKLFLIGRGPKYNDYLQYNLKKIMHNNNIKYVYLYLNITRELSYYPTIKENCDMFYNLYDCIDLETNAKIYCFINYSPNSNFNNTYLFRITSHKNIFYVINDTNNNIIKIKSISDYKKYNNIL